MRDSVIRIAGLYKHYETAAGEVPVLKDINLTIEPGEVVAIMGPSGSGKSTFMNILGCLDSANAGSYFLNGEDVGSLNKDQLARLRIEVVGLGRYGQAFPNQISGGQQQRVAIARALINGPRLILADEPTGNLDTQTSAEIMDLFTALIREGITIVRGSHVPDIAVYTQRLGRFVDGHIVHDGTHPTTEVPERTLRRRAGRHAPWEPK